jgi:predicted short-subunit dehydrogenase-like oxidoreductase (DUF2520 family)
MTEIIILGAGNVGYHLANKLIETPDVKLVQIYNRNIESIRSFKKTTPITDNLTHLKKADIYIICVTDEIIPQIAKAIKHKEALIVHTSGSTPLDVLSFHTFYGVFYPLQTFSKNRKIDFNTVPICIEVNKPEKLVLLENLGKKISNHVYHINSEQRKEIHKAAVFVNNFVNHLYYLGEQICENSSIDPKILYPLIRETGKKIENLTPYEAQTGPARRGDIKTIQNHLNNLQSNNKEIYKLLSQSIADTYGQKL